MATHTRHWTLKSAAQPHVGRKALVVIEVALGIILAGALFAPVESNLIPVGAQAAPEGPHTLQSGTPGAKAADPVTTDSLPLEAWYTPAQYRNLATEIEPLADQF